MSPEKKPDAARTAVLAIVAFGLVATVVARAVRDRGTSGADPVVAAGGRPRANGTGAASSASQTGGSLAALHATYKPIVDADPFKVISFRKGGGPKDPKAGKPVDDRPAPSTSSGPSLTGLRLTGVYAIESGDAALLENRGTGKGLFVRRGERLGQRAVLDVRVDAVVLATAVGVAPVGTPSLAPVGSGAPAFVGSDALAPVGGDALAPIGTASVAPVGSGAPAGANTPKPGSAVFAIGDKIDGPPEVLSRLADLGPVASTTVTGGTAKVELTDEKRLSVLEQLKAKRQASLASGGKQ